MKGLMRRGGGTRPARTPWTVGLGTQAGSSLILSSLLLFQLNSSDLAFRLLLFTLAKKCCLASPPSSPSQRADRPPKAALIVQTSGDELSSLKMHVVRSCSPPEQNADLSSFDSAGFGLSCDRLGCPLA